MTQRFPLESRKAPGRERRFLESRGCCRGKAAEERGMGVTISVLAAHTVVTCCWSNSETRPRYPERKCLRAFTTPSWNYWSLLRESFPFLLSTISVKGSTLCVCCCWCWALAGGLDIEFPGWPWDLWVFSFWNLHLFQQCHWEVDLLNLLAAGCLGDSLPLVQKTEWCRLLDPFWLWLTPKMCLPKAACPNTHHRIPCWWRCACRFQNPGI